jgi:hypothetical protein
MDTKLSELSKPSAEVVSKFGDPEAFGERELKVLADIQKLAYGTKFYSQEYVSALKHESAVNWEAATSLAAENEELKRDMEAKDKRIAELEQRLDTPVRLPETYSPDPWMGPDPSGTWLDKWDVKEAIRAAGFTVGDE